MSRITGFIVAVRSRRLATGWVAATALFMGLMAVSALAEQPKGGASGGETIAREDEKACLACHENVASVYESGLKASPHKDLACQDCHSSIDRYPHTTEMLAEKATCATCHSEADEAYRKSIHSNPDKKTGDHPTCASCHGKGGDPHAVTPMANWSRMDRARLCSDCHADASRVRQYGFDPVAVTSYNDSFHGKALLRFGMKNAAICSDCHNNHDVLHPQDAAAPTHRNNVAKTCSQSGCHAGAQMNFSMSGANHLGLKIKTTPILRYELSFFRFLIFAVIASMLVFIAMDLVKQVFGKDDPPRSGRLVGTLISVSFFCMVGSLGLGTLQIPTALYLWLAAVGTLVAAFLVYFVNRALRPESDAPPPVAAVAPKKTFTRWTPAMRAQHVLMMVSFSALCFTGLPLRFANYEGINLFLLPFGGLDGGRIIHRVAGILLIVNFFWHILWLLYRWKQAGWSFKSWTMLPSKKDFQDVFDTFKYYFGLQKHEPRFDRYQFRSKVDYWAEWWGTPLMAITGLILWFPIFFGNRLPEPALSMALIAHSYEATLAFLAIVTWHMYNVHLNPHTFPQSRVWYTGTLTREEMEHEHPAELERLERAEGQP